MLNERNTANNVLVNANAVSLCSFAYTMSPHNINIERTVLTSHPVSATVILSESSRFIC